MHNKLVLMAAMVGLVGCSTTDRLYIGTYTRVGIDASQDGAGGGIGVKNVAMTIAPTKASGEAYDILGTTDIDLAFTNLVLAETIATGEAAECASGKGQATQLASKAVGKTEQPGPLIFAAATSWSLLDVSLGEAVGPGISFGYRRTVGISMPIKNETIGSTFASVSISTLDKDHPSTASKTEVTGTRSVYTFATGKASVNMAQKYASKITGNSNHAGCPN